MFAGSALCRDFVQFGFHPKGGVVILRTGKWRIPALINALSFSPLFSTDLCLSVVSPSGSSPSPGLSVSRRFVSPDDSVEVTCSPPLNFVHSCHFYRDEIHIADGSCRRNLTGKQLSIWEKSTILLPVNMTCTYHPYEHRYVRSEPSNHNLLFVVGKAPIRFILNHIHSQSQPVHRWTPVASVYVEFATWVELRKKTSVNQ